MNKTNLLMMFAVGAMITQCGCESKQMEQTGFLSDYSRLEPVSDEMLRYFNPNLPLSKYKRFIIDPVEIYASESKLTAEEKKELTSFMESQIRSSLGSKYPTTRSPGPGVGKIRVALTDIDKSSAVMNILPATKVAGTGLGGAAMEAELVDSVTGEQIGAIMEYQKGSRLSLEGLSKYGDAKAVMKGWAKRFRKRLDEAHGY